MKNKGSVQKYSIMWKKNLKDSEWRCRHYRKIVSSRMEILEGYPQDSLLWTSSQVKSKSSSPLVYPAKRIYYMYIELNSFLPVNQWDLHQFPAHTKQEAIQKAKVPHMTTGITSNAMTEFMFECDQKIQEMTLAVEQANTLSVTIKAYTDFDQYCLTKVPFVQHSSAPPSPTV